MNFDPRVPLGTLLLAAQAALPGGGSFRECARLAAALITPSHPLDARGRLIAEYYLCRLVDSPALSEDGIPPFGSALLELFDASGRRASAAAATGEALATERAERLWIATLLTSTADSLDWGVRRLAGNTGSVRRRAITALAHVFWTWHLSRNITHHPSLAVV